jgi:hypothetical protein
MGQMARIRLSFNVANPVPVQQQQAPLPEQFCGGFTCRQQAVLREAAELLLQSQRPINATQEGTEDRQLLCGWGNWLEDRMAAWSQPFGWVKNDQLCTGRRKRTRQMRWTKPSCEGDGMANSAAGARSAALAATPFPV